MRHFESSRTDYNTSVRTYHDSSDEDADGGKSDEDDSGRSAQSPEQKTSGSPQGSERRLPSPNQRGARNPEGATEKYAWAQHNPLLVQEAQSARRLRPYQSAVTQGDLANARERKNRKKKKATRMGSFEEREPSTDNMHPLAKALRVASRDGSPEPHRRRRATSTTDPKPRMGRRGSALPAGLGSKASFFKRPSGAYGLGGSKRNLNKML